MLPFKRTVRSKVSLAFVCLTALLFVAFQIHSHTRTWKLRIVQRTVETSRARVAKNSSCVQDAGVSSRKVAIVHYCGGERYANISDLSEKNVREYAYKHNLEVHVANETSFPSEVFFTPKAWLKFPTTSPPWRRNPHTP